jgi:hypothetical protein
VEGRGDDVEGSELGVRNVEASESRSAEGQESTKGGIRHECTFELECAKVAEWDARERA